MPQQTKIFRVFVSSTFTDMREERRMLQKVVFPKLEKLCESKGAKFQAVDVRWGVNEESQLNQKTLEICLNEIARCQRISPKPNFIILLGDKYGWQPIPTKIPAEEMNDILKVIAADEKLLIVKWYWLDENAIPKEYVLQPRGEKFKEYSVWEKTEIEIRNILRLAVSKLEFKEEQNVKYFASATHQEIISGALNPSEGTEKPEEHVFAYVRTINDLPRDKAAKGFIDLIDNKQDDYCLSQLKALKSELKEKLKNHFYQYKTSWNNIISNEFRLNVFAAKVYEDLEAIIESQAGEIISTDEIEHEKKLQQEFKETLTEHFCGREEIISVIWEYLNNSSDNRTLSIIGDSGSGKSSVMAQAVKKTESEKSNALIIYRFIGTSSRSSNILSFLLNLCGQIANEFNSTLESLAGEGKEKSLYEMFGLTEIFAKCLALGNTEKPIILFLDALDQLSDSENVRSLHWIPKELPPNAKFIVSSLPELEEHLQDTEISYLPVLPEKDAKLIVDRWFAINKRQLAPGQSKELLSKFGQNGLPIYLKLAFERAKHWHSYDTNISLQPDVQGIINDFFQFLETEHTVDLVKNVICYMLCGKYQGLTENEILEILVFDKEYWKIFFNQTHEVHKKELEGSTKIPIVVWSRFFLDIEPFLTERDADGVTVITFFHRVFAEVLKERYGLVEGTAEN